jgi:16S rRNA (adenine1518-N6/adenine1519-N6)-dimethyltransferase
VREVLERWAIVPRKRYGQNFLHDPAVAARIAASAGVGPGDAVLEIGPGLGALTRPLLASGARVTAIEVDRRIADYLEDELGSTPGFELIRGDVLSVDLDGVAPGARVLVGNLPYSITGPLLALLIDRADRLDRAVVMVQREVGARLTAGAGGRELGAPAVLLRLLYRVERVGVVGRGAFLPAPDVQSLVLRLDRIPGARLDPAVREAVNRAYRQRRKMIRKTLKDHVGSEAAIAAALVSLGHPDSARPEELEPEDWPRLLAAIAGEESA